MGLEAFIKAEGGNQPSLEGLEALIKAEGGNHPSLEGLEALIKAEGGNQPYHLGFDTVITHLFSRVFERKLGLFQGCCIGIKFNYLLMSVSVLNWAICILLIEQD